MLENMKRQKIEMESKLKNREDRRDQWIKQAKLPNLMSLRYAFCNLLQINGLKIRDFRLFLTPNFYSKIEELVN